MGGWGLEDSADGEGNRETKEADVENQSWGEKGESQGATTGV